ncbi:unnamed protein product [Prorocentrum cordatum]|uniref:Secreted protein n=1 Tax=Prorocentrum cordatum TaxID=2364126 RepID=A0ABN9SYQ1_9DINO|nr:unnamed protein product [Polarella glacialis]
MPSFVHFFCGFLLISPRSWISSTLLMRLSLLLVVMVLLAVLLSSRPFLMQVLLQSISLVRTGDFVVQRFWVTLLTGFLSRTAVGRCSGRSESHLRCTPHFVLPLVPLCLCPSLRLPIQFAAGCTMICFDPTVIVGCE